MPELSATTVLLAAGLTGSALIATNAVLAVGAQLVRRLGTQQQAFAVETFAGIAGVVFLWQAWTLA